MPADGIGRHHHVLGHIPLIGQRLTLRPPLQLHHPLRVGKSGGGTHHHRGIVFFAQVKGQLGELLGLGAVRRLQHGNHGRSGHHAAVLLVLGAVHAGVVCGHHHQTAAHSRIGSRKQRIRSHVHPHVLHAAHGPDSGNGSAYGHLRSHLLIGRPLPVNLIIFGDRLADLRAGRAGICRRHPHPRLISASRYGLVSKQYLLL